MSLKQRVTESGVISPQEVAEVLGISLSHARNLTKGVEAPAEKVPGRSGVAYMALIDALYEKRSRDSFAQAQKLETALGVRKKYTRQLHIVSNDESPQIRGGEWSMNKQLLITVEEMAAMLSIGRTVAWELVRKRKIKSVKIGRTRRVPIVAIQEYIEQLMDEEVA